ncbi:hypothetical protein [Deinococcus aquaedulcis]|uniref:hypothetical protein n=1 Tax=Deinococcus aquaedulcis TaxID=2840455 RepID=UPI001F1A9899|nr:hypothetical protein [Deinococcus aquaedulcis]
MLSRPVLPPPHIRLSWLVPLLAAVTALALLPYATPQGRTLLAGAALFDATLTTALLVWAASPRQERHWPRALLLGLRGALVLALCVPLVRDWWGLGVAALVAGAALGLRGLRRPLPEGFAELDDVERAEALLARALPSPRMARLLSYDALLWPHLWRRPALPEGQHFGTQRGSSVPATVTLLLFYTALESLPVHFVLAPHSPTAAALHLAANALGAGWLLAYTRALARRPLTVTHRRLYLRTGLHWTASTPLVNVQSARAFAAGQDAAVPTIAVGVKPNVVLTFAQPVRVLGPYGMTKTAPQLSLHVDDPKGFLAAVEGTAQA